MPDEKKARSSDKNRRYEPAANNDQLGENAGEGRFINEHKKKRKNP